MAGKEKKSKGSPRWEKYKNGKTSERFCPRCGPGIFLAKMKDRVYCGKCQYTEFIKA